MGFNPYKPLNPYKKKCIYWKGGVLIVWSDIGSFELTSIWFCFLNPALAAACTLTRLYDESHTTNITSGLVAGLYIASAL